jgi:hypothetical protein
MPAQEANNIEFQHAWTVASSPSEVFPLLCPVREYDWIDTWRCELVHTESGFAEQDCIFRTEVTGSGTMTWVVSRYEAPVRIEFTCFVPDSHVMRLSISLHPQDSGTRLLWKRKFISVSARGNAWIAAYNPEALNQTMTRLEALMKGYLSRSPAEQSVST